MFRSIKWKNSPAKNGQAYQPTEVEQIANVISHGVWILPAIYASVNLILCSPSYSHKIAALIYGGSMSSLFTISTCFHGVSSSYFTKPRVGRTIRTLLHRCDRAIIYVFIAGTYFPWLSLGNPLHHKAVCNVLIWAIWTFAALGILYQQMYHERFKTLDTIFYLIMGLAPSTVIMLYGREFQGMMELKMGGIFYMIGVIFFKSDGIIPFAHSIWHFFVVVAASIHYYAIFIYLYAS